MKKTTEELLFGKVTDKYEKEVMKRKYKTFPENIKKLTKKMMKSSFKDLQSLNSLITYYIIKKDKIPHLSINNLYEVIYVGCVAHEHNKSLPLVDVCEILIFAENQCNHPGLAPWKWLDQEYDEDYMYHATLGAMLMEDVLSLVRTLSRHIKNSTEVLELLTSIRDKFNDRVSYNPRTISTLVFNDILSMTINNKVVSSFTYLFARVKGWTPGEIDVPSKMKLTGCDDQEAIINFSGSTQSSE